MSETRPTVYLIMDPGGFGGASAITRAASGEILETTSFYEFGQPDWRDAGICDHRGAGGPEGFALLARALDCAEDNAKLTGFEIERVGS